MQKQLRIAILAMCCGAMCAQGTDRVEAHKKNPTPDPAWAELNSSIQKMHTSVASLKPSGNSDLDFIKLMLPHHQAAIEMAKTQLLYGKDPQLRRLAQEIITDQNSEIELMQHWIKQHEVIPPPTK